MNTSFAKPIGLNEVSATSRPLHPELRRSRGMDVRKTGGVECAVWVNLSSGGRCPPHGSPSPLSFECPVWADSCQASRERRPPGATAPMFVGVLDGWGSSHGILRLIVMFASPVAAAVQWHPPTSVGIQKPLRVVRRGVTTDLDPIVRAGLVPGGTADPYTDYCTSRHCERRKFDRKGRVTLWVAWPVCRSVL
jgi:hypothetical protein